ncbi:MAG: hypothetical protein RLZZ490_1724 [Cyanobacteriota bacterium]
MSGWSLNAGGWTGKRIIADADAKLRKNPIADCLHQSDCPSRLNCPLCGLSLSALYSIRVLKSKKETPQSHLLGGIHRIEHPGKRPEL